MAAAASCASSGGASALAEVVEARARRSEGPSRGVDQSDDRPASDDPADPREPAGEPPAHTPEPKAQNTDEIRLTAMPSATTAV